MADDPSKLLQKAIEQMGKKRFDKAAEIYLKLCEADPKNLTFRQRLGDAQRQAGQPRQAVATYQLAADHYARNGELLKAIAVNKAILEIDPKHKDTQATLAKLYALKAGAVSVPGSISSTSLPKAPAAEGGSGLDLDTGSHGGGFEASANMPAAPAAQPLPPPKPPDHLPETPIFSDLDPAAFVDILQRCTLRRFEPGQQIIRQGEAGSSFFVVSSGVVSVSRADATGRSIPLAQLREGAFFGEMALVRQGPRTASVVADEQSELLEFPAVLLQELMTEHPSARAAVEKFISNRLIANVMAISPLFQPFDAAERKRIIQRFKLGDFAAGDTVFAEGAPSGAMYIVVSGRFLVQRRQEGGEPQILAELHEGDLCGEISVLTDSEATADVVAAEPGRMLKLTKEAFEELVLSHPQIRQLAARVARERTLKPKAPQGGSHVLV